MTPAKESNVIFAHRSFPSARSAGDTVMVARGQTSRYMYTHHVTASRHDADANARCPSEDLPSVASRPSTLTYNCRQYALGRCLKG